MEQEILEIKALIDQLRAADTEFRVSGATRHRYRFGTKLTETEIQDFESKHDIILPTDYRLYLQLVGNGNGEPWRERTGAWTRASVGPSLGLYPLAETIQENQVNQPFPFETEVKLYLDPSETAEVKLYHKPDEAWGYGIPGALEISTMGCVSYTHLIVKGPQYGTIWLGYDYLHFIPTHLTFSQWMRAWVKEELQVLARQPLVERIKIGMSKDEVIAATGEGWAERIVSRWTLFENPLLRVQLELDEKKTVSEIRSIYVSWTLLGA